ncbi:MAG: pyridoxal-phosphate dependent enzyme [Candidatus Marsarchaeota archaeon]|nr:pyridoxal-phosphate dependent enzyme [Candidatus Marsarchaeota archaeon]
MQNETAFRCDKCGSILEVAYDYPKLHLRKSYKSARISQNKYKVFYPVSGKLATLGEGSTRLKMMDFHGIDVYLKIETSNPTRTFKDRGTVIEISKALSLGINKICCASTGNMALSISHYSRVHKMECTVFISKHANKEKISRIRKEKAKVILVDGGFNRAIRNAEAHSRKTGSFLCGDYHYRKEGQKSIAFEIVDRLSKAPDFIFVPIGNGTLFAATYKGLLEYRRFGIIKRLPRLVAVQSKGCNPLTKAFIKNKEIKYVEPKTYADAIAVGYPIFGLESIEALRKTNGLASEPTDKEISAAVKYLSKYGVCAEPGGATAFAGFVKLHNENPDMFRNKKVAVVVSGNNED